MFYPNAFISSCLAKVFSISRQESSTKTPVNHKETRCLVQGFARVMKLQVLMIRNAHD